MPSTTASVPPRPGARDLWGFLAFSHGWTWFFWGIVVYWGVEVWDSTAALTLFAIGGLGLPIGGVFMTWRVAGRDGLHDLGRRLVQPGRLSGWWWVVAGRAWTVAGDQAGGGRARCAPGCDGGPV